MQPLAEPVANLIDAFCKLPGIGPKTATRLTYFLLRGDEAIAKDLAAALEQLKARTLFCHECHNIADSDPCAVCANAQRETKSRKLPSNSTKRAFRVSGRSIFRWRDAT